MVLVRGLAETMRYLQWLGMVSLERQGGWEDE